jgi:hypothetical protein
MRVVFQSTEALTSVSLLIATTRLGVEVDVVPVGLGVFPNLPPEVWRTFFTVGTALAEALGGAIIWVVLLYANDNVAVIETCEIGAITEGLIR